MDSTSRYRFLGIPSSSTSSYVTDGNGDCNGNADELNEDDIFLTNDSTNQTQSNSSSSSPTTASNNNNHHNKFNRHTAFPQNSGILAALPEYNHNTVLYRKPSLPPSPSSSSSRAIPLIPRSPHVSEYASQSVPIRKMNQSAPMNVPVLSMAMAKERSSRFKEDDDGEFDGDEEMLPPHEIVARGSRRSPKTTFSVLEGVGRTLKGRDLRQRKENYDNSQKTVQRTSSLLCSGEAEEYFGFFFYSMEGLIGRQMNPHPNPHRIGFEPEIDLLVQI
ncbi:hypothetical protein POTOM_023860 [Populus tomentosa]|uniref:Uncharacterized protein n=1 Tax=Populus tomentosa TaxID=118781 RepID=A0A8X8A0P1_POPTO|nr:hypothetical protein POTOM_023860 [Populus tomentosa]